MRFWKLAACVLALAEAACAADVTFATKPIVTREGEKTKIAFALSGKTDVEVAILGADGRIVRHLAAGVVGGETVAEPLKPGLAQSLDWDGKDDAGTAVIKGATGSFRARVRLGMAANLDRILGWDPQALNLNAWFLAVGKEGELFVLDSMTFGGDFALRVFSRDGKYLRTISPYPANLPYEKIKGFGGSSTLPDKFGMPIVHNGFSASLFPLASGVQIHNPAVLPDGRLVFVSGRGTWAEQNPPLHLLAINPDGSCPESGCVGPRLQKAYGFAGGDGGAGTYRPAFVAANRTVQRAEISPVSQANRTAMPAV